MISGGGAACRCLKAALYKIFIKTAHSFGCAVLPKLVRFIGAEAAYKTLVCRRRMEKGEE